MGIPWDGRDNILGKGYLAVAMPVNMAVSAHPSIANPADTSETSAQKNVGNKSETGAGEGANGAGELSSLVGGSALNLVATRDRAAHLQASLTRALATLQPHLPAPSWNETLGQFAVLNVQIQNLTSEMRPLLKHYLAHPCSVSAEIAAELPQLLRTKLLPEMEVEEDELLKHYQKTVMGQSSDTQHESLQKRIDQYNSLCERADSLVQVLGSKPQVKVSSIDVIQARLRPAGPAKTLRKTAVSKRKRSTTEATGSKLLPTSGKPGASQHPQNTNALLYATYTGIGLMD